MSTETCPPPTQKTAAIIGGSLGGLAAAQALHQNGWQVTVLERAPQSMSHKGSGLGYVNVAAWESLCQRPMWRRGRRASRAQGSFYYGDLWAFLYDSLPPGTVQFGTTITEIGHEEENSQPENDVSSKSSETSLPVVLGKSYDLVIVANGGFSSLRRYVLEDQDVEPTYAGYIVWRGSIPVKKLPPSLEAQVEEGVYKDGIYDTIVLKMAKDNGEDLWTFGTFIATPEEEVSRYWDKARDGVSRHGSHKKGEENTSTTSPEWFRQYFQRHFGQVPGLVPLVDATIESGELKPHPQFEFGNIDTVCRGRIILLGDAAHMASPRTAVGAHTAILDALALREAFRDTMSPSNDPSSASIEHAISKYNPTGVQRAQELYW
eukprot:CAMPEP_0168724724 /NCGR_PEP_ID=MMETSP0724-20121128/3782_1 /TAXON_ID=265536 /ORGANISM="Amphiprora sp., Strain CCMP467" /LENGTH=375 /DNA_ID=CAMNT_0008771479 /DNA_START=104 /DNA_END=1228 /DNA_ORIENTATION=+